MKEHFVNYNQALALKEIGFDEPCLGIYYGNEKNFIISETLITNSELDSYNSPDSEITAPLKSQVFKWFRKNHSINGIVSYYGKGQWNIEILDYKGNELIQIEDNTFWSYEEAESACIDKLISILKEKKS